MTARRVVHLTVVRRLAGVTPGEPDEAPTERQPAKWIGSSPVRRRLDDTLDLPIHERVPPEPEIRYVPVPVYPPPPQLGAPAPRPGKPTRRPYGPLPPPTFRPRPRRKWPWVLLFLMLLCGGCCGGAYAWAKPFYDEYPATA